VTALEALGRADYIASIAARADVDRRTVAKCLRGESPLSTIWIAVQHAAEAMGITDMPRPAPRAPRIPPPRPCAACAAKDEELADLRSRVVELDAGKAAAQAAVVRLQRDLEDARRAGTSDATATVPTAAPEPTPRTEPPRPAPRQRAPVVRVLMPDEELEDARPVEAAG
jgi:hypothetical protein